MTADYVCTACQHSGMQSPSKMLKDIIKIATGKTETCNNVAILFYIIKITTGYQINHRNSLQDW